MRITLLTTTFLMVLLQSFAQTTISFPSAVQQTNNVLRYDVSFGTSPAAKAYVEYYHLEAGDTVRQYTHVTAYQLTHTITLVGLLPQTQYHWRACAFDTLEGTVDAWSTFTTAALPSNVAYIDQVDIADPNGDGYIMTNTIRFAASVSGEVAQIYDRQGRVVWYQFMDDLNLDGVPQCKFTIATDGPKILYSGCNELLELGFDGTIISNPQLTGADTNYLIHHDIIKKDNGNFLAIAALPVHLDFSDDNGPADSLVVSESVIEVDPNGDVVWAWNSYEHLDTNNLIDNIGGNFWATVFPGSGSWLHANGMDVDLDGGIIVSMRKSDQLMKINPNDSSLIWTFGYNGDYSIAASDRFKVQHCPTVTGGSRYLLFDNTGADPLSRVSEFRLIDYQPRSAQQIWEYVLPSQFFSAIVSSAYRLPNGNTLIGAGVPGGIVEVDPNGNEVLQFVQNESFYRANYVPSMYEETAEPSFTAINDTLCVGEIAYQLTGTPAGGYFTGTGVTGNIFSPSAAGVGTYEITYHYGWKTSTQEVTVGCTGIRGIDLTEIDLQVFPNPASDKLTVQFELDRTANSSWNMMDLTGRVLLNGDLGTSNGQVNTTIDVSDRPTGMYLIGVSIDGENTFRKVIVE